MTTRPREKRVFRCACGEKHDLKYDELSDIVRAFQRGEMQTVTPAGVEPDVCLVTGQRVSIPVPIG